MEQFVPASPNMTRVVRDGFVPLVPAGDPVVRSRVQSSEFRQTPGHHNPGTHRMERPPAAQTAVKAGICGAPTKSGKPCQSKILRANGRCKAHGGA